MPDIKHTFTGGKMNKDLDERLVPNGEYRDAMNVQVQTSEGSDVGTVQNILGNNFGCDYSSHANPIPSGSKTVGSVSDEKNDSLYWFIAGPSPDLEFPIENSISFKDMIMRTNKYKSTGCEPVFVDLWKYCTTINPLPGFSDNSISLLDTDGYDVVTTGMYATGYSGTGAGTIEFGPTLVTGVGNYNIIPLNYNIGSTVVANTYTPPLIEISDNTNTVMYIRGFWNDNGGHDGNGGYTDTVYRSGSGCTTGCTTTANIPVAQLNLPAFHMSSQFWIPIQDLTALQQSQITQGVEIGNVVGGPNILAQAYSTFNSGQNVLNGAGAATVYDAIVGQVFDQFENYIDALIITVGVFDASLQPPFNSPSSSNGTLHVGWSEQDGTKHDANWYTGIWQKNASITAGFQQGEAYPFYEIEAGIQPLLITNGVPTPNNTIVINDPQSQTALDEIFNILFDFDGISSYPQNIDDTTNQPVQLQVNSSWFPSNSCVDPNSVINPNNGFSLGPPMTFSNVFEIVDCDTGASVIASNFNLSGERAQFSTAVANGVMKVWLQDKVDLSNAHSVCFEADKTLSFEQNKLITSINIVDDMLFWTDGYHSANDKLHGTEPKKINIKRSIQGTSSSGMTHTGLHVDGLDFGPAREEHVTVIRKAPPGPPTLEMTKQVRPGILGGSNVLMSNNSASTSYVFYSDQQEGDSRWGNIESINGEHPSFEIGDIVRIQAQENGVDFKLPNEYQLRLEIIDKKPGPFVKTINWLGSTVTLVNATVDQTAYLFKVLTMVEGVNLNIPNWYVQIEDRKNLFERKFPRFAYRYKYVDNEYSSFGPFSEVAFIPGSFDYAPIDAYNTGMTNRVKSLVIKDFVSAYTPSDVVQVDILYKNETSPTIYLLDSVYRNDSTNNWNTSSYEVSTESVFAALPVSQSLRGWDNVPRISRTQEVTGNRLVYGNYIQGYDIKHTQYDTGLLQPNITTSLDNRVFGEDNTARQSIKSLRTYDVGVVWGDKYGRETPVITSTGGSLNVPKSKSLDSSYLAVDITTSPHWADYYRFYIKETSNEYYNLPVDRVYDAEDGNIWVSFPSVDRNKVDEDTYIILKKGIDSSDLILEDARYKIVAIENEAPEYIKTNFELLARSNTNSSRPVDSCLVYGGVASGPCDFGTTGTNAPAVGMKGFSLNEVVWSGDYSSDSGSEAMGLTSPETLWKEVKENSGSSTTDELFVSFTKEKAAPDGTPIITKSDKYQVVSVELVGNDDDAFYYIKLDSPILSKDEFIVGNGDMEDDDIHQIFWKKTIRNKPEFDGRFFVKILNDNTTNSKLKNEVGIIGNWKIEASLNLFSIIDDKIVVSAGQAYGYANSGAPSTTTRTDSNWNARLKFGGNTTKSEWFIDGASFASKQGGSAYDATGYYSDVQTFFNHPSGPSFDSCDVTSHLDQSVASDCGILPTISLDLGDVGAFQNFFGIDPVSEAVGTGESKGLIGMKGVHNDSTNKYFDLSHSKIGPKGATGTSQDYELSWSEPSSEDDVVANLQSGKRFRLEGDEVIYEIKGVTKHRLFNYHGKKTCSPAAVPSDLCGPFINNKEEYQVGQMGDERNRRVTYRIKYDIDVDNSPAATDATDTLEDNSSYGNIDLTNSVRLYFIDEFRVEGENPISSNPAIFETEPKEDLDLDLYYEASSSLPTFPITERNKLLYIPVGSTIVPPPTGSSAVSFPEGVFITGWYYIDQTSPLYTIKLSTPLDDSQFNFLIQSSPYLVLQKDNGEIVKAEIVSSFVSASSIIGINILPVSKIGLNWFNCWSFNNGVESNRVGDTYNKPFLNNGVTASTTTKQRFKEEHRKYGLIYSGIYNSNSSINNLNQFIAGEKITKDINPTYGSIQKLYAGWGQGGDLIALCEDRVLKILADKDALYNADGNVNITSTNNVLGQATPYSGEYGISKNPESFASDAYRAYFTDKARGAVMRLSRDGLTPISEHGMKDWFKDNLKLNSVLVGSYDDRQDEYNITLKTTTENTLPSILTARTVSFSERAKGWVSFKSFTPENSVSCANDYYTFKNGNLYKQHDKTVDRNTFYPYYSAQTVVPGDYTDSSFTVLINESPGTVKTFHTLNYEGSQSKIDELQTYNTLIPGTSVVSNTYNDNEYYNLNEEQGWHVQSIKTDLEEGSLNEFIEKEGKWFNYIKGVPGSITDGANIDGFGSSDISFQGLGRLSATPTTSDSVGCTDDAVLNLNNYQYPSSTNYDPNAVLNDGSCIDTVPGCMDATNVNYNPDANWDIYIELGYYVSGACAYYGCTDDGTDSSFSNRPADAIGAALNYDTNANIDDGSCTYPIYGCTDATATNYDGTATVNEQSPTDNSDPCIPYIYGCMQCGTIWENQNADTCPGGAATTDGAINFNPLANTSDPVNFPCQFAPVFGCITATACNYDAAADTDDGSCLVCGDNTSANVNNYDAADPGCTTGCEYCEVVTILASVGYSTTAVTVGWIENWANAGNANVDTYRLRHREAGTTAWTVINNIAPSNGSGQQLFQVTGFSAGTTYEFQVKSKCSNSNSTWSNVVSETTIPTYGCTDPTASNYDGSASNDDGSCIAWEYGCMDSLAINYDSSATADDGSCCYTSGCTDPLAFNYDATACDDDGSCVAAVLGCTDASSSNYDATANTDDGNCIACVYGCTDATADNSDPNATCDDGSCLYAGCMYSLADNYNPNATTNNLALCNFTTTPGPGCTDATQFNYDPNTTSDDGSCQPFTYGCTDSSATNYNSIVNTNDGSCIWLGCTDATATNYDPTATVDDGSCIY
tara:strand:- start:869 stop:9178 length:8310 start_codon:yes stop_codon:yes gene_type:complete